MSEKTDIQNRIEKYLEERGIKYIHIENNKRQQQKRKNKYKKYKGCPDNIIPIKRGITLWFEYKLDYNNLSNNQKGWFKYLEDRDHLVFKVISFEEGKIIIDKFLRTKIL